MSRDRGKSLAILGGTEPQDVSCSKVATFFNIWHVKGALLQGFCRFLTQTILKLVVPNLIHSEHYL